VLLGWLLLQEPVGGRTFIAMAMILGAVIWIQFSYKLRRADGRMGGSAETPRPISPSARPPVDPEPEAST